MMLQGLMMVWLVIQLAYDKLPLQFDFFYVDLLVWWWSKLFTWTKCTEHTDVWRHITPQLVLMQEEILEEGG